MTPRYKGTDADSRLLMPPTADTDADAVARAAAEDATGGWHALEPEAVGRRLGVDEAVGLDPDEVRERRERFGANRLQEAAETRWWVTLGNQFRSPLITILLLAGLLTMSLGDLIDASVIAAVLILNASIGFVQERRAEASVRALMGLVSPSAHVVRAGHDQIVDSEEVVPGDVVLLESGVRVPADLRLVRTSSLRIDESLLTGESVAVEKHARVAPADAPLAERFGMAYAGSTVTSGRGRGVVVATGDRTELGRIAEQMRRTDEMRSPLQERMRRFAHLLGAVIVASALGTFLLGLALGESPSEMLLVAAALAVAAIPEGLPVVLTVALALGVRQMARRNAIVRHLSAVETLGSTTLIGSDKTGTLTENRMTVTELWADGELVAVSDRPLADPLPSVTDDDAWAPVPGLDAPPVELAILAGVLANESTVEVVDGARCETGDPTETAFLVAALRFGLAPERCRGAWREVGQIPFESEHRYAAAFCERDQTVAVFVKGAPERVLDMCAIGPGDRDRILAEAEAMAGRGLRVLATAYRVLDAGPPDSAHPPEPDQLAFLGLHGLLDPPRPGVREAIDGCRHAGQRVIMITGDHATTARAIAHRLDIVDDPDAPVLTGRDLDEIDDVELCERLGQVSVFARVSPTHKLRIVEAARELGHVVAVTGDGVNDAPALKRADIGVAMGVGGTDVAREAADIVLADDNFVSIHAAVEQGRVTFDNVRKVTFFLVSTGLGTFVVIPIAMVLHWPLILLPAQLLWANLVTKGLQDLALAFEEGEPDVLDQPPRPRDAPVITAPLWWRTLLVGSVMAAGTLGMFHWAMTQPGLAEEQWRAVALTTLVLFQAFHLGSCRSELRSVFAVSPLSNRFLVFAQLGALVVHVAALYLPFTQFVLRVEPVPLEAWVLMIPVAVSVVAVVEVDKAIRRVLASRS